LPPQYREIFNEWIRARTLPTDERPDKYKDPAAAATHFLSFIPSVEHLKDALDVYIANKKADRERDESVLRKLPHSAAQTIASSQTLKSCGVSISGDDLAKKVQILNDEAFFKVNVNRSIDKLKHINDSYDLKVVMGAQVNEDTKAFTDKGIAYFKNDIHNSTVVHETLHLLCRTPVKNLLGGVMTEGMTELLTQWACDDAKANYTPDYIKEKKVATAAFKAVGLLSKSAVARAYFTEPKEMASLLEKKMGKERFERLKSTSNPDDALKLFES
jgi:hypothetical protein